MKTKTWIGIILLAALLSGRVAVAQTVGSAKSQAPSASVTVGSALRSVMPAPIGHRQPRTVDVPSENAGDMGRLDQEDVGVDRKLNICRGC